MPKNQDKTSIKYGIIFQKNREHIKLIYLIITSISSMVLQNGLFNYVTKKRLNSNSSILSFNFFTYIVCIITFGIIMLTGTISLYTVILGLLFGVVTFLSNTYKLFALTKGPMHLTLLFTTSSMIIPSLSGVFFGEGFSPYKLAVIAVLLVFLYLSFEKNNSTKIGGKWFFFCLLAFLFQGAIGILQKVHQSSTYKDETAGFLFIAFICASIFSILRNKGKIDSSIKSKKIIFICLICGACTFAMNFINLKLSGMLPSQLFFPLVNGSSIVLSSIMSVVLFKEHLTIKQTIGLIGGILSLIAICLVP